jgi:N6-adenosine-specific RNA methylase IME4
MTGFACIAADPPWKFGDKLPGDGRGAEKHYGVMDAADICRFALPPIADDAVLFCWRVAAMQQEALDVVKAWDFTLKSELVWKKLTKHGKRWFGMGRYVRAEHETCLIATRGRPQILDRAVRSVFEAPAGRHSEKPEEFFQIVERLCGGPRVELFARRHRANWTCYGNELTAEAA